MKKISSLIIAFLLSGNSQSFAQTCDNSLETALTALPSFINSPRSLSKNELPVECLSAAMDTFYSWTLMVKEERKVKKLPEVGHYTYCTEENQSNPKRLHTPPCQTEKYLSTIQNSYNDVLTCLDLNPKTLFPVTAVESGFHINSVSLTNDDIGLGQITPVAIKDVNAVWDLGLNEVTTSSKESCKRIAKLVVDIAKSENTKSYTCSLTALPMNPVKNLLYLTFLHKKNVNYINQYFSSNKIINKVQKLTQISWTEDQIQSLKDLLVTLSYNVGNQGATQLFNEFLELNQSSNQILLNEIDQLKSKQVDLYLKHKTLLYQGKNKKAEGTVKLREEAQARMKEIELQLTQNKIPMDSFNINENKYSFGSFLTEKKQVFYLSVLKDRVQYIENTLLSKPGYCSQPGYLTSITNN